MSEKSNNDQKGHDMPLIVRNDGESADMSRFAGIMTGFDANFLVFLQTAALSLSARIDHACPNLAALVKAVRMAANASQMEFGLNRRVKTNGRIWDGITVPSDLPRNHPKYLNKGWFSLIANIEQGGRKTPVPSDFVTFLANVLDRDEKFVLDAIAQDDRLSAAFDEIAVSAPVQPEKTETVGSTVSARSPEKGEKSDSAAKAPVRPGSKGPAGKR